MVDGPRIIPTTRLDGAVIMECPCGYRAFVDAHGKKVCPRCNRGHVIEPAGKVGAKAGQK